MSLSPIVFLREGGWVMFPILLVGGMGVLSAIAALLIRQKAAAVVALALALGCAGLAAAGTLYDRSVVDSALASVSPEFKDRIREVGYRESMRPAQLGGGLSALALPLALLGLALSGRRKQG